MSIAQEETSGRPGLDGAGEAGGALACLPLWGGLNVKADNRCLVCGGFPLESTEPSLRNWPFRYWSLGLKSVRLCAASKPPLPLLSSSYRCGLVALWMAGAHLHLPSEVPLERIRQVALERGYTAQGEMFSGR